MNLNGENEPYPVKNAKLLKQYLPQMKKRVYKNMGHPGVLPDVQGIWDYSFMGGCTEIATGQRRSL